MPWQIKRDSEWSLKSSKQSWNLIEILPSHQPEMQSLVEALVESAFTAFLLMPQFAFEQTFMNKKTFLIRRQMLTQIFKSDVVFAGDVWRRFWGLPGNLKIMQHDVNDCSEISFNYCWCGISRGFFRAVRMKKSTNRWTKRKDERTKAVEILIKPRLIVKVSSCLSSRIKRIRSSKFWQITTKHQKEFFDSSREKEPSRVHWTPSEIDS